MTKFLTPACPLVCRAQREPLRLHKNWGMALLFFAMWDALLLALGWWAIKRFGGPGLRHWRVRIARYVLCETCERREVWEAGAEALAGELHCFLKDACKCCRT